MMRIRLVDFVANAGGGIRFVGELVPALLQTNPHMDLEVVSHGEALERYQTLFARHPVRVVDVPPHPIGRINRRLDRAADWAVRVPPRLLKDVDVVWFPWVHRHLLPRAPRGPIVGSLHDLILFQFPGLLERPLLRAERKVTERWLRSSAQLVVSSRATVATAGELFGVQPERLHVVPLSGVHEGVRVGKLPDEWTWARGPFLLLPANIFPHKNHEVVFAALAQLPQRMPLALTGPGSDLVDEGRGRVLRDYIHARGLELGSDVIPLGLVPDDVYAALLARSAGVVMPTLGEGGGSFPVWEALHAGVPVACSDIPVLREQVELMGASVTFFDPRDPRAVAASLGDLIARAPEHAAAARAQVNTLNERDWRDVARDYGDVFAAAGRA